MITKGQTINDRYEVIRSIGEGGMANVYLGYDTILDRNVAIKVLRGDLSNDEKFVRRFQREALSASSPEVISVSASATSSPKIPASIMVSAGSSFKNPSSSVTSALCKF